jgi:uncharacterized membrane protein
MPINAIRISGAIVCLVFIHVAILDEAYAPAVTAGLVYSCISFAIGWFGAERRSLWNPWSVSIILMIGAEAAIWCGYTSAVAVVLAPAVASNVMLLVLFGHTLLPGREPLITRFRRYEQGYVSPKFASYTRSLTMLWVIHFGIATVVSVAAALRGDTALWSWVSLIAIPLVSLSLFLGEHIYRAMRFGPEGRSSPMRTLAIVLRPDAWREGATSRLDSHGSPL